MPRQNRQTHIERKTAKDIRTQTERGRGTGEKDRERAEREREREVQKDGEWSTYSSGCKSKLT